MATAWSGLFGDQGLSWPGPVNDKNRGRKHSDVDCWCQPVTE